MQKIAQIFHLETNWKHDPPNPFQDLNFIINERDWGRDSWWFVWKEKTIFNPQTQDPLRFFESLVKIAPYNSVLKRWNSFL